MLTIIFTVLTVSTSSTPARPGRPFFLLDITSDREPLRDQFEACDSLHIDEKKLEEKD